MKTAREAIGPNVDLMADCYMGWNVEYAKRMLRLLEPYNLRWVEEPVIADDLAGYAELRALNYCAISGGEHEYTLHGFRQALDLKAFDSRPVRRQPGRRHHRRQEDRRPLRGL